jgi:integration host factor subunit beta
MSRAHRPPENDVADSGSLPKGTFMHTVTKKELVDRISEKTDTKRVVVKKVVQLLLDEMIEELGRGNRLEFRDFGVFETKARAARVAQNPKTLQRVQVPPKRTVKFKVGRMMKQKLHQGLSHA